MHNGTTNGSNGCPEYFDLKDMPHIIKALDRNQKLEPDILHVIGNTPLVKLNKIPKKDGLLCDMFAKCEYLNPGGSIKDRIAYRMVQDAEEKCLLVPGKSVIIEPTSGNTGIGLALAAAVKGYRCIIVLPEKMSDEKVNTLLALGAEIIRTPTEAASHDPDSNLMVAKRLAKEIPNAVMLDQYTNACNPLAHYDGTAEEILWSLDDDVDMVVIGAGTCGTVSGIGHKVKERCPKCVIVGVDPLGSILAEPDELNDSDVGMYEVEGIGYDFLPKVLDRKVVDKWVKTEDKESLTMSRRLIKEEGLLCGGSSGAIMWAATQAAKSLRAGQKCVVILPDNIRNYMTKFISDQWMETRAFKPVVEHDELPWWNAVVTKSLVQPISALPHDASAADALAALRASAAPAVAVVNDDGAIIGVVTADYARRRLTNLYGNMSDELSKFTQKKYYSVDVTQAPALGLVSRMLDMAPFVVIVESVSTAKKPIGIFTSDDLLRLITDKSLNVSRS